MARVLQVCACLAVVNDRHVARGCQRVRRTPRDWRPLPENFIWLVFQLGQQSADYGEQEHRSCSPTRELKVQSPNISVATSKTDVGRATTVEDLDVRVHQVVGHIRGELHSRFGKPQRESCCCVHHVIREVHGCWDAATSGTNIWYFCEGKREEIFKNYARRRPSMEENSDLGLAEVFALCDKDIFPSLNSVLQLLLTVPQTSVTVERLLLRSLMTTERLTFLCLVPFEKDLVRAIDRQRILTHFKNSKNRRLL